MHSILSSRLRAVARSTGGIHKNEIVSSILLLILWLSAQILCDANTLQDGEFILRGVWYKRALSDRRDVSRNTMGMIVLE